MTARLNPYLGFRDNGREAMTFYHSVLGGDLVVSSFAEMHASTDPAEDDLVMHSMLTTPDGLVLMGSDTPPRMGYKPGDNYSVSLSGDDEALLTRYWNGLAEGATVTMPLGPAVWGGQFGMLRDRYGVQWVLNIEAAAAQEDGAGTGA